MTLFLSAGIALVSLIALLLIVLRLRSGRSRLIAVAVYALGLVAVVTIAGASREQSDPLREYGREIDRAVADLGERYVLFRSLGPADSTTFDDDDCGQGAIHADHRFLQRTWRLLQPVDFPDARGGAGARRLRDQPGQQQRCGRLRLPGEPR